MIVVYTFKDLCYAYKVEGPFAQCATVCVCGEGGGCGCGHHAY